MAPATAYTYFSSKNHLIAEVYLDLVRQVPYFTDVNEPMAIRSTRRCGTWHWSLPTSRGRRGVHDGAARRWR
ncbi:transcriptional regulator, TetR family protein [Mycobacterium xenopi 4042]|uniref:Transcriptional regulator, TetR family protein n=1 Tax=Mycobacterium xenopi 4042 TaxID=1299334 RepID=X8CVL6_MYCXE|nr:transcriptional regulator, TetR family protein [Mycobacterium xenopi 4042]